MIPQAVAESPFAVGSIEKRGISVDRGAVMNDDMRPLASTGIDRHQPRNFWARNDEDESNGDFSGVGQMIGAQDRLGRDMIAFPDGPEGFFGKNLMSHKAGGEMRRQLWVGKYQRFLAWKAGATADSNRRTEDKCPTLPANASVVERLSGWLHFPRGPTKAQPHNGDCTKSSGELLYP